MGEDDPVEALLQLANNGRETAVITTSPEFMESDEGIVSDQSNEFEDKKRLKTEHVQTIYQCTWPGCDIRRELCDDIERHVREFHLRRADPTTTEEDDREEEFYYTEIDIPIQLVLNHQDDQSASIDQSVSPQPAESVTSEVPAPLLSDHMDMARPPHENPEYGGRPLLPAPSPTFAAILQAPPAGLQWPQTQVDQEATQTGSLHAVPIAIPITTFTIATNQHSPGKYIRLSPKPYSTSPKSPLRRPRGDAKKCRKVYGMEHRELWCTQCKWKKACTRFGEGV